MEKQIYRIIEAIEKIYIRLFVSWTVRNRRTDRKRYNIYSTTIVNTHMYSLSNELFTGLVLHITQK